MSKRDGRFGKSKRFDLIGSRFDRWTVLAYAGSNKHRMATWNCRCDCGIESVVSTSSLRSRQSRSCGCLQVESCATKQRASVLHRSEFNVWNSMMARCYRPSSNRFEQYAARGIKVCERWHDFHAFLADMGPRPHGHTIERKDVDGDYCPENCIWLPLAKQACNRRDTIWFERGGERMCLSEWCARLSLNYKATWAKYRKGCQLADLLNN